MSVQVQRPRPHAAPLSERIVVAHDAQPRQRAWGIDAERARLLRAAEQPSERRRHGILVAGHQVDAPAADPGERGTCLAARRPALPVDAAEHVAEVKQLVALADARVDRIEERAVHLAHIPERPAEEVDRLGVPEVRVGGDPDAACHAVQRSGAGGQRRRGGARTASVHSPPCRVTCCSSKASTHLRSRRSSTGRSRSFPPPAARRRHRHPSRASWSPTSSSRTPRAPASASRPPRRAWARAAWRCRDRAPAPARERPSSTPRSTSRHSAWTPSWSAPTSPAVRRSWPAMFAARSSMPVTAGTSTPPKACSIA